MFSKLFEERDKTISYLVKLGDCIGRSLRENITLFSIDSQNELVTYLTEQSKVISGNYVLGKDIALDNIQVQDSSIFENSEIFDKYVNEKIHTFVENIHFDEYGSADNSFADVLSLWENRLKLNSIQDKLYEKSRKLEDLENIIEAREFQNLIEITPQFITFLQENFEKVSSVPEVRNAVNLSNAISNAFNFPKLSYQDLEDNESYILKEGCDNSIYEMVCRQELVKRELIESKRDFNTIWASNPSIKKLAGYIFESDEKIIEALSDALREVPYLALASKSSLFNTFNNCLAQVDGIGVSERDIQKYASTIFEVKKEAKEMLINTINEKYGVSIQNLQEPTSFRSLVNTQVVIFESLSRLSKKGSVLKQVLSEVANLLKTKSGVEGIDVNDYINEVFRSADYGEILESTQPSLEETKIDFKRISKKGGSKKDLTKALQDRVHAEKDSEYSSDENVDVDALAAEDEGGTEEEAEVAAAEGDKELQKAADKEAAEAAAEEAPPEEENPTEDEATPKAPETESQEDVIGNLAGLEAMIADIAAELNTMDDDEEEK